VDFIALPPPILPTVEPGPDDTICAGMNVALHGTAQQYDTIRWTTTGDGVFANDTLLNTLYTPGTNDLISGNVTLRLTGFCPYGSFGRNKQVHFNPRPVAAISVLPNDTVCAGQSIILSSETNGVTSWNWIPGDFVTPEATFDTSNAGGTGTHLIRLLVANQYQCQNRDSVYLTFKNCTGMEENISGSVKIYPNPGSGLFLTEIETLIPGPMQLTVTNATSEVVYREDDPSSVKNRSRNIDLTFLPDGVYLLSVTTNGGTSVHKLIIRK
jgi:hypothetical protein